MVNNFMTSTPASRLRFLFSQLLKLRLISLALLLVLTNNAFAATLTATVDRKQITENDSFRLFLRFDEQVGFGQPDLTELKKEFRVINQQRSNQFRSMNGKTVSFTEWTLVLSPLRTGSIVIPAIEFNGQKSQPIQVSVSELPQSVKEQIAKEFFFDIDIDSSTTYVQAQVLYTEKLYYSINHEDATLSELKVTDALVVPLGQVRQYTTSINGQRMGVYERRYAIFAEESGEMVIPGQKFSANVVNSYNRWSRGRPVSVMSEPIRIQVKATPSNYPQSPWLPSPEITVSDRWSKPFDQWQVGEPITRNISITAQGLSGSQLPSIALPVVEGIKYYPDQSEHQDQVDTLGVKGSLQQSLAIVPTQSGRITLPEMRIPWWNVKTDSLEYARLPAQTLYIKEAAQTTIKSSQQTEVAPVVTQVTQITSDVEKNQGYWVLATLILLFTNVITAFLLWKKTPRLATDKQKATQTSTVNSQKAFNALKQACQKNDAQAMRQHLKHWSNLKYGQIRLDELGEYLKAPSLTLAISELDSLLYQASSDATANSAFNGQILWNSLKQALNNQDKQRTASADLKPLY